VAIRIRAKQDLRNAVEDGTETGGKEQAESTTEGGGERSKRERESAVGEEGIDNRRALRWAVLGRVSLFMCYRGP
jgi:hypothetical protein